MSELATTILNPESNPNGNWGHSIAVCDGLIAIDAPYESYYGNGNDEGMVRLYTTAGEFVSTLISPLIHDIDAYGDARFGWTVAMDENFVAVGSPYYTPADQSCWQPGLVSIFDRQGNFLYELENPNELIDSASSDCYGKTIALCKGKLLVGSHWDDTLSYNCGRAYLYDLNNGGALIHVFEYPGSFQYDENDDIGEYACFGQGVDISETHIIISAGSVGEHFLYDINCNLLHQFTNWVTWGTWDSWARLSSKYVAVDVTDSYFTDVYSLDTFELMGRFSASGSSQQVNSFDIQGKYLAVVEKVDDYTNGANVDVYDVTTGERLSPEITDLLASPGWSGITSVFDGEYLVTADIFDDIVYVFKSELWLDETPLPEMMNGFNTRIIIRIDGSLIDGEQYRNNLGIILKYLGDLDDVYRDFLLNYNKSKCVVTNIANEPLPTELVINSVTNLKVGLFFEADYLTPSSENIFFMYYNNDTAIEVSTDEIWSGGFTHVNHFGRSINI